jgi:hypothetical protein
MRRCRWRRGCYCRGLGTGRRFLNRRRLRGPGRFRDRLRPCGRFSCHRHRGLGIGIHRLRLGGRRRRLRHCLRPVRRRLLHRPRSRRSLAVAFCSHYVFARIRDRLGEGRHRFLHRQRRLGLVGVGRFRLCRFRGLRCLRGLRCPRGLRCLCGLGWLRGLRRLRRLGCLRGLGRLSGIRSFVFGYRWLRRPAYRVLRRCGRHRRHRRRDFGFG